MTPKELAREEKARARAVWELNLARVWNSALELAASIVHNGGIEEERDCAVVVRKILRKRKSVRPRAVEKIFRRRAELLDKRRPTKADKAELDELRKKIANLPTGVDVEDQKANDLIRRAASLLKRKGIGTE